MPLVALLSLTAVLIPVVFFVLDLSKPIISGWGSYVRWVGAAAASVVVWEWVERIEALEREEKKDGILGREIFDGDEMLDATPSSDSNWPSQRKRGTRNDKPRGPGASMSTGWHQMTAGARYVGRSLQRQNRDSKHRDLHERDHNARAKQQCDPTRPLPVASPVSRADATSAGSTIYDVRYHPVSEPSSPIEEYPDMTSDRRENQQEVDERAPRIAELDPEHVEVAPSQRAFMNRIQWLPNPFRRQRNTPPPEVVRALAVQSPQPGRSTVNDVHQSSLMERLHFHKGLKAPRVQRPVIVVPAPARDTGSSDLESEALDSGNESDGGGGTERSRSILTCMSTERDADLVPGAVTMNANTSPHQSST